MKASLDQQAGQMPSLPTGSRQAAHRRGSATSTARPSAARNTPASRVSRPARACVMTVSPSIPKRYRSWAAPSMYLNVSGGLNRNRAMAQSPVLFDRALLRRRRRRAAALGPSGFLLERVAEDFSDRLDAVLRRFDVALDLGTPGDALRRVLAASGKVGTIIAANALVEGCR